MFFTEIPELKVPGVQRSQHRASLQSLWAGPKEAPLGLAPHALVRLATAVGICGVREVCVEMVVLRRKWKLGGVFLCFMDTIR